MKFAVLGHLMKRSDLRKFIPLGRFLPVKVMEGMTSILPAKKSFQIASEFTVMNEAKGYLVALPLTPYQMKNLSKEKVRNKILEAVLYAQNELGVELIMLGALTAPLTSAGIWLKEHPKVNVNLTTGNTYTAEIAIEAVHKAANLANLDLSKIKIAIVGATGVTGGGITKYFHKKGRNLILVGRTEENFKRITPFLKENNNYELTTNLEKIKEAEIIITATSHPDVLIHPPLLKEGAIVVDVTEPSDLPSDIEEKREDVIAIDGGRVEWGDIDLGPQVDLPSNNGFACIAEGMLQALEEEKGDHVGSIELEHIKTVKKWADKWDFKLADFTCFNKPIPLEKFKKIN